MRGESNPHSKSSIVDIPEDSLVLLLECLPCQNAVCFQLGDTRSCHVWADVKKSTIGVNVKFDVDVQRNDRALPMWKPRNTFSRSSRFAHWVTAPTEFASEAGHHVSGRGGGFVSLLR